MRDVVVGLLGILVGAVFCFRGWIVMRAVLAIWGGFAGFLLGAGAVTAVTGDGFLSDVLAWLAGIVVALVFAALAYAYYAVSVLLAMASVGFVLGATLMVGLGIEWTWVIVVAGVVVGTLLALAAVVGRLPLLLLVLASATGGASAIVGGIMFLTGEIDAVNLDRATVVERIDASPWWWLLYLAVAVAGVLVQLRSMTSPGVDLRREWERERAAPR